VETEKLKILELRVELKKEVPDQIHCIGYDPGTVNMGIAEITSRKYANLYQIWMKRDEDQVKRITGLHNVITDCIGKASIYYYKTIKVVIEGASFGNPYRQTELGELRGSAVLWFVHNLPYAHIEIVPPSSIRKQVFGSGKVKAHEHWAELEKYPDACAALSCAYYAGL